MAHVETDHDAAAAAAASTDAKTAETETPVAGLTIQQLYDQTRQQYAVEMAALEARYLALLDAYALMIGSGHGALVIAPPQEREDAPA